MDNPIPGPSHERDDVRVPGIRRYFSEPLPVETGKEHDERTSNAAGHGLIKKLFCDVIVSGPKREGTCIICKKVIKGGTTSTSNFLNHYRRCHKTELAALQEQNSETQDDPEAKKKKRFSQQAQLKSSVLKLSGQQVLKLVAKYIVTSHSPLTTLEEPGFIDLCTGLHNGVVLPSRRVVREFINSTYKNMNHYIAGMLASVDAVCTTADIWSGLFNKRSFLGVTAHYLDAETKVRVSVALACRIFDGKHTYDRIGQLLCDIHKEFRLRPPALRGCVTDNASNFKKAFKEFGIEQEKDVAADEDGEEEEEDDGNGEDPPTILDEVLREGNDIVLPEHVRCASHSLSLTASNALKKAMAKSRRFRTLFHALNGKASALWNKCRFPSGNEMIRNIIGRQLPRPCPTRWNSLYDALHALAAVTPDDLSALFEALHLPAISTSEREFLAEIVTVLQPCAVILDSLQGEQECTIGHLIPAVMELQHKLQTLAVASATSNNTNTQPLIEALIEELRQRFEPLLDLDTNNKFVKNCVLASVFTPKFKLNFVKDREMRSEIKLLALHEAEKEGLRMAEGEGGIKFPSPPRGSSGLTYSFMESTEVVDSAFPHREALSNMAQLEFITYLNQERGFAGPLTEKLYIKYNTLLPSSAPVERLFSNAGVVSTARRSRLTPALLEQLVCLSANKTLKEQPWW